LGARPKRLSEQLPKGIELRRSKRLLLQLPIQVRWTPPGESVISEHTITTVVNAHGALVLLAMKVKIGARVFVRNLALGEYKECRVVRVGEKPHGKNEVGLEFMRADAKFWGLEFPPDDWKEVV
jgi:hypothetical protein